MPVCIGALCSNACVHASMCTNVHVCGCVLEYSAISSVYLSLTGPLGGEDEPLVIGGGGDTDSLVVDQPVVAEGVTVGQVEGLGGERLLDTPLLQEEAGRVPDDGSGDFGGHVHLGSSGTKEEQVNTQGRKGVLDPSQN